jgi:hypothetical protein
VWNERHELLGEIGGIAERLQEAASHAAARFARKESGEASEEAGEETEVSLEAQPTLITAPDESSNAGRG